jgi:hypothetical protein
MFVKMLDPICGLSIGQIVSVSDERGMLWVRRGFALPSGEMPAQKPEPKPEEKPATVETAAVDRNVTTAMKPKAKHRR